MHETERRAGWFPMPQGHVRERTFRLDRDAFGFRPDDFWALENPTSRQITRPIPTLHDVHTRARFGGTRHEVVPSLVGMQSSMEPRAVSLEGPPYVFPKWGSRLRSNAQQPPPTPSATPATPTERPADTAPVANTTAMAISKGRAEFEAAVRPAMPRLFRFCLSLTGRQDQADDLFQNTLIKAYVNAASFEGRSDVGVWLCGIAWHEHLELRRTEARRKGLFSQFVDACSTALGFGADRADTTTPETLLATGENQAILLRCLQTLPEEFRAVVVLCDIEELGYERAAEILGIPKGTVKSRHARGRVRLREAYEKLGIKTTAESSQEGKESTR